MICCQLLSAPGSAGEFKISPRHREQSAKAGPPGNAAGRRCVVDGEKCARCADGGASPRCPISAKWKPLKLEVWEGPFGRNACHSIRLRAA
jgi:hypothetical protein